MAKYAAYIGDEFQFVVHAESAADALKKADEINHEVTRVELVSEVEQGGR